MLRHGEQSGLDHQGAQTAAGLFLPKPNMLGDGGAEGAAADNEDIERPAAAALPGVDFGNIVAEIASLNVLRERCPLCALCHIVLRWKHLQARLLRIRISILKEFTFAMRREMLNTRCSQKRSTTLSLTGRYLG